MHILRDITILSVISRCSLRLIRVTPIEVINFQLIAWSLIVALLIGYDIQGYR